MLAILKRYSMAFLFLLLVTILMIGGTMAVTSFGESMVKDMGIEMTPRGEHLEIKDLSK